jgi:hypothetical protein
MASNTSMNVGFSKFIRSLNADRTSQPGGMARTNLTEEQMLEARQELDRQFRPYRGKMTADQFSMLEE